MRKPWWKFTTTRTCGAASSDTLRLAISPWHGITSRLCWVIGTFGITDLGLLLKELALKSLDALACGILKAGRDWNLVGLFADPGGTKDLQQKRRKQRCVGFGNTFARTMSSASLTLRTVCLVELQRRLVSD